MREALDYGEALRRPHEPSKRGRSNPPIRLARAAESRACAIRAPRAARTKAVFVAGRPSAAAPRNRAMGDPNDEEGSYPPTHPGASTSFLISRRSTALGSGRG